MKKSALLGLLLCFVCVHPASAGAQASAAATSTVDVSSSDGRHVTLTEDSMETMPQKTVRIHNPHSDADETCQVWSYLCYWHASMHRWVPISTDKHSPCMLLQREQITTAPSTRWPRSIPPSTAAL